MIDKNVWNYITEYINTRINATATSFKDVFDEYKVKIVSDNMNTIKDVARTRPIYQESAPDTADLDNGALWFQPSTELEHILKDGNWVSFPAKKDLETVASSNDKITTVADKINDVLIVEDMKDNIETTINMKSNIDTVTDKINEIQNVSDNIENIKINNDNKDSIKKVGNEINSVVRVANIDEDLSVLHDDANMIQAYLNVDLGSASVNDDGDLIVTQINADSTPSLNDDGYLVVTYS